MADQIESSSLDSIFNGPSSSDAPASSTSESDKSELAPASGDESSPAKDESTPENKDEKQAADTTVIPKEDEKTEEKPNDKTPEQLAADATAKTEADASAAKEATFEKRWTDTVSWANELKRENSQLTASHQELQKQIAILQKQIADPDYDAAADPANQGPSSEDIASQALIVGKTVASRNSAYQAYGKEQVDNCLTHFHGIFKDDPWAQQKVQNSESPIHEAINMVERHYFEEKHGKTPQAMYASIEKEVTDKQRAALRKEILEEIKTGKAKKDGVVEGLSSKRGSNGVDRASNAPSVDTPLSSIFG